MSIVYKSNHIINSIIPVEIGFYLPFWKGSTRGGGGIGDENISEL
jgi:hypothetical protein